MEKTVYLFAAQIESDNEFNYILSSDLGTQRLKIRILRETRVSVIANMVVASLGTSHTIRKLIVLSHGNAGQVGIGAGMNSSNIGAMAPLRAKFSSSSEGVIFHGCRIASGVLDPNPRQIHVLDAAACDLIGSRDPGALSEEMSGSWNTSTSPIFSAGYQFLCRVAETMNVKVTAAVDRQISVLESSGHGPRVDITGFEGRYVQVSPDRSSELLNGTPWRDVFHSYCDSPSTN